MKNLSKNAGVLAKSGSAVGLLVSALLFSAGASALPLGWSSVGTAGTMGSNGHVTTSPQGGSYNYVSTVNGVDGVGLGLGSETTGSTARSTAFTATAGEDLNFFFNYITSDGGAYTDYAWVRLLDAALNPYATLFTARTSPDGNTVPGFGMPDLDPGVTLDPASVEIVGGSPVWSALGIESDSCYAGGCGYTDWVEMSYTFAESATYYLEFGVVNWSDEAYASGLAFDGILVGGVPLDPQPVSAPSTLVLFGAALMGLTTLRRRSRTL